jgi:hypothetical protein
MTVRLRRGDLLACAVSDSTEFTSYEPNKLSTSEGSWLNKNSEIFGTVRLAAHLYHADGGLLNVDFPDASCPRPSKPVRPST